MSSLNYSFLISVYSKENPLFLRESLISVFNQTLPSNDVVLVCDGPLTDELDEVINDFKVSHDELNIIRLPQNVGLGSALAEGLKHCKNDIIARADTDDINSPTRMEKQIREFSNNPALMLISSDIIEFQDDIKNETGRRVLPKTHDEIIKFSRKRNPMNHPAVAFRKEGVLNAGSYNQDYPFFEDYSLWVRMLQNGCVAQNIDEALVYMRMDKNTYDRRGGLQYAKDMLRFHKWLKSSGWSSSKDYLTGAVPHAAVCILPRAIRLLVYKIIH